MRGSNLDINIAVNSDKARADLELLKAQFRATTKEIKALSNEAAKTGDRTKLDAAIPAARKMEAQLKSLNRTFAQTGDVAQATGNKLTFSARSFRSLDAAVFNLGKQFGAVGIAAFAAFRGINAGVKLLDDMIERITKIRDLARETAQKPAAVAAAQNIARATGEQADAIDKMMKTSAEAFAKLQAKRVGGSDVNVMRGGAAADPLKETREALLSGVNVMRGGKQTVLDLSDAFAVLTDRTKKYRDTKEGMLQYQLDLYNNFLKVAAGGKLGNTQLNELAKSLTGLSSEQALKVLPEIIAKMNAEMAKIQGPLSAQQMAIGQLEKEQGLLANAWNTATEGMLLKYTEMLTAATKATREILVIAAQDWGTAILTAVSKTQGAIVPSIMNFLFGPSWVQDVQTAFGALLQWMQDAATATANAIARAFAAIKPLLLPGGNPANAPQLPQNAAGGMIRGAGSGTSDSILARLSNGEFVMRARAVEHWGPRFMAALNGLQNPFGYHAGGLVRPSFADGGLVAAGGGSAPVHLHLGGREFALAGSVDVVGSLVAHARQSQMRSSGVKPSWYGGRPNY